MCGLVGVLGTNLKAADLKLFQTLMFLNILRGEDGTGIISLNKTKDKEPTVRYDKGSVNAVDFMEFCKETTPELMRVSSASRGWMGHCRAATIGKKVDANCHPFQTETLLGMHNGTINGQYPHKHQFETDSEALYTTIDKHGLEKGIQQFHNTFGAWALAWYDTQTKRANFFRNSKRPLNFAYSKDERLLIYSSEPLFLKLACLQMHIEIDPIWSLKENLCFSADIGDDQLWNGENTHVTPIKHFKPIEVQTIMGNKNKQTKLLQHRNTKKNPKPLIKDFQDYTRKQNNSKDDHELYVGPNYRLLGAQAMQRELDKGCANCSDIVLLDDFKALGIEPTITWLKDEGYVCQDCVQEPAVQSQIPEHLKQVDLLHYSEDDYLAMQYGYYGGNFARY
jgi:predicted glutamine amidotransferase